jgi:putative MATE family efflux protein
MADKGTDSNAPVTPDANVGTLKDWTQGSILNNLLNLAWPVIISSLLTTIGPTIDMIWVGKLGASTLAAVGLSANVIMVLSALEMGLFASLRAMVSRSIGAHDEEAANNAVRQAFFIGAVFSLLVAVVGIFLSRQILSLFGADPAVVSLAVPYNRIQFVGMITMTLRMITEATLQSSGDTMTAMKIGIFFRGLHITFCPFWVFGWWIFPQLGAAGAATMDIIAQGIGGIIGVWFLMYGRSRLKVTMRDFRIDMGNIKRQLRVGIPASINQTLRSFVGMAMLKFVVPFGTMAVAAHSLSQRLESFMDMGSSGLGAASGVLAGQNMGARKVERAEKTGWLAMGLVTAFTLVTASAMMIWAKGVVHIFNNDPNLDAIAINYLRIAAVGFLFMGPAGVLTSYLNGVGDTMVPLIASLVSMWAVQIPLAWYLPKVGGLGVFGVRWSMAISLALRAVIYLVYFRMGKWKHTKV